MERAVFGLELGFQERPEEDVGILEQFQEQAHGDRNGDEGADWDATVREYPVSKEEREDGDGQRGDFENGGSEPGGQIRDAECGFEEFLVYGGEEERPQDETAAKKNEKQAEKLVSEIRAILRDAPDAVESHLERFEDPVGGEEEQGERDELGLAPRGNRNSQVALEKLADFARQVIVQGEVDGVHGSGPVKRVLTERDHDDQEGIEGKKNARRDGKRKDVDFGLGKESGSGTEAVHRELVAVYW